MDFTSKPPSKRIARHQREASLETNRIGTSIEILKRQFQRDK